jgi:O-antigen ligase
MQFRLDKITCYFLLVLIVLYYSQGILIPEGIGALLLGPILAISIVYIFKMLFTGMKFTPFIKMWLLFIVIYTMYFIFTANYLESSIYKAMMLNFIPFFPFYYFSKQGVLKKEHLIWFLFIVLPIFSVKFVQSLVTLRAERMRDEVVDNTIYLFIGLLPFVFLIKRKLLSFALLLIIWFLMVQSTKRAAIVCGVIALLLFVVQQVYISDSKIKLKQYIVSMILLIAVSYFGYQFYAQNQFLQERMGAMLEGDSSGRDMLTQTLLNQWYHSDNIMTYLFGFGYNSARKFTSNVSHNDWVDMLVSFGVIGFLMYLALFRNLILQFIRKDSVRSKKLIFLLVFSIAIITSLTSRWYAASFAYMQMILLPYILATRHKDN